MSFVKLDNGILDSTLWAEPAEVRIVYITILAMCGPDGVCPATAPGIARRANLPLATVRRALRVLASPDPDSRSTAEQGRRIKRIDGGYLVVNYLKYRTKDHTATLRKRRQRERQGALSRRDIVTVTQGEGEAEADGEVEVEGGREAAPSRPSRPSDSDRESDTERHELAGKLKQAARSLVESALAKKPDCGLTIEGVISAASRVPPSNGHAEKSFTNPDAPGISAHWLHVTLSKLPEVRAAISRQLFPPL